MKGVRFMFATSCTIILQVCEHFNVSAKGHARRYTVGRGHQPGLTPNKIAPPPVFSHEPYPPLASQKNVNVLNELKCVVCSNILSRPLELPCRKLVCTSCVVERVAASTTVCPCCSALYLERSNVTLLLLKDVQVQCMVCYRDVGSYEGHECTPTLTAGEEREAAALLKRTISTSPDKGILQLPTEGAFSITYLVMSYLTIPYSGLHSCT